jgi:hypothetical protein
MGWVCVSTKEELFPGMSHINCPLLNFTRHVFEKLYCLTSLVVVMCVCIFHYSDGTKLIPM